ncbi:hypothetical protein ABIC51_002643 [Burkholderia sp. 572]
MESLTSPTADAFLPLHESSFEFLSLTVKTKEERSRQQKLILLPSRLHASPHLSMPAIRSAGSSLDRVRRPGRYLGIEVDDALETAEQTET